MAQQFNIIKLNHQFRSALSPRSQTKYIVIHHSDTDYDVGAARIHEWHLERENRTWAGIGYNYVIRMNGIIETGRPENMKGAHAGPSANGVSIGICLAGNFVKKPPTEIQLQALAWLIQDIWTRYPGLELKGHSDFMATTCPGPLFPWARLKQMLKKEAVIAMFKDIVNHWAKDDIDWLAERGLLAKAENFRPNDTITRAETAVLIRRAIEYTIREVTK